MMAVVGIWHKTRSTTKERGPKIKMGSALLRALELLCREDFFSARQKAAKGCTLRTRPIVY
jgi:hypothetical protein